MNELERFGVISGTANGRYREILIGKNKESEVERLERELNQMNTDKDESEDTDEEEDDNKNNDNEENNN